MTKEFIPYGKQFLDDNDIEAVSEVLRSDWLTTGPVVEKFEAALAARVGAKYCAVFNSGTAALHAAYHAAEVGSGDEVITTPITFAATANAALYLGAKPIFVDIAADSYNIDHAGIEAAITSKTKVIAPVDMTGIPAALDEIKVIAKKHDLVVVEDASHALGAMYKGKPVGSISDMTVFSFHPVKHITTGEGGAVTTNNEEYYYKLKRFRSHGIVKERDAFKEAYTEPENNGPWYHEQQELGYNYRLSDINCALGLSQLEKLDYFLKRRREIAGRYNKAFLGNDKLLTPTLPQGELSLNNAAWHLYVIRLTDEAPPRKEVVKRLYQQGIGTQVHYIPVYWHPYYQALGYKKCLCPNSEEYYRSCLSLPIYPAMDDKDVSQVIETVIKAMKG